MSDEAALLAAVLDRPADDGPRLVYADYLDDIAGDTPDPAAARARAEFIRVQCEFARLRQADRTCPFIREYARHEPGPVPVERWTWAGCQCRGCELVRREDELYTTSEHWMLPSLPDAVDGVVVARHEFDMGIGFVGLLRRGFVESVTCPAADWLAHADAILAAHPVRRVRLTTEMHVTEQGYGMYHLMPRTADQRPVVNDTGRIIVVAVGPFWGIDISQFADRQDYQVFCAAVLSARYPGITFELPVN